MRKSDELKNPKSCMSRAKDDEMTFVLLGRDIVAPLQLFASGVGCAACMEKINRRIHRQPPALACADTMEREQNA